MSDGRQLQIAVSWASHIFKENISRCLRPIAVPWASLMFKDMLQYIGHLEDGIVSFLHKCEVLIYKAVTRVLVWHHEALLSDTKL